MDAPRLGGVRDGNPIASRRAEPAKQLDFSANRHNIKQLAAANADDLNRSFATAKRPNTSRPVLVEAEYGHRTDADWMVDEVAANRHLRDRVPIAPRTKSKMSTATVTVTSAQPTAPTTTLHPLPSRAQRNWMMSDISDVHGVPMSCSEPGPSAILTIKRERPAITLPL
jgi:hypothetical protein